MILPILEHMNEKRIARFWARVSVGKPEECWEWRGRRIPRTGYGVMSIEPTGSGKVLNLLAHRISLTLKLGRDLVRPLTRHSCNNPPCCNDAHILEGTALDNWEDSVAAGTAVVGVVRPAHLTGVYGCAHPASRYTAEQRAWAIKLWSDDKLLIGQIARRIGCRPDTITRWLYDAFPNAFRMPASTRKVRRHVYEG